MTQSPLSTVVLVIVALTTIAAAYFGAYYAANPYNDPFADSTHCRYQFEDHPHPRWLRDVVHDVLYPAHCVDQQIRPAYWK